MPFLGEQVTRRRREQTGTDRYGNPVFDLVDVVLDERCAFDPGGSREPVEIGREQTVTTPKAYFPDTRPDITAADVLVIRGQEFTVQGVPADWRSPFGADVGGVVVELEAVDHADGGA